MAGRKYNSSTSRILPAYYQSPISNPNPDAFIALEGDLTAPIPFTRNRGWLPIVLASWVVTLVPMWVGAGFSDDAQASSVPKASPSSAIRAAWEPETEVRQARRLLPQGTPAAVNNPPFSQRRPLSVRASWEVEVQAQQQRRFAPQSGVQADAPPFSTRRNLAALAWEQVTWDAQRRKPLLVIVNDDPSFGAKPWKVRFSSAWPLEYDAVQGRRFSAATSAQLTADNPPPLKRGGFYSARASWEPTQVPLWSVAAFSDDAAVQVDNPPFGLRPWQVWVREAWQTDNTGRQKARLVVQGAQAQVDNPPFGKRPWSALVRDAWSPADIIVWQGGLSSQEPHEDPPFGAKPWTVIVLRAWAPEPQQMQPRRLAPITPTAQVDNPPFGAKPWALRLAAAWAQDIQPPQKKPSALLVAVSAQADNPPFGQRIWLRAVRDAWESAPEQRRASAKVAQAGQADQPFSWFARLRHVLEASAEDWFKAPQPKTTIQGAAVNNPPFGAKPWKIQIVQAWQPGPPDILAPLRFKQIAPPTEQFDRSSFKRIYLIDAENRLVEVQPENRLVQVEPEDRKFDPSSQDRKLEI